MTLRQLSVYLMHVPAILAREAMTQAVVASMPYMEEDARMEVLTEWARVSGSEIDTGAEKISMEEFGEEIKKRVI